MLSSSSQIKQTMLTVNDDKENERSSGHRYNFIHTPELEPEPLP